VDSPVFLFLAKAPEMTKRRQETFWLSPIVSMLISSAKLKKVVDYNHSKRQRFFIVCFFSVIDSLWDAILLMNL